MDIWVVAAAAGAGYVAKHCKSLAKGRHSFSESSINPSIRTESSSLITPRAKDNKSCPGSAMHSFRHDGVVCSDIEMLSQVTSMENEASSSCSGCQNHGTSSDCSNPCSCSGSNLLPGIPSCEDIQGIRDCGDVCGSDRDSSELPSTKEIVKYGFKRKKSSLRSRRANAQLSKPVNSLESCLMAQLYRGQAEVEDSSMTPPCTPTVRQFSVTRGGKIIGRPAGDSSDLSTGYVRNKVQMDTNPQGTRMILGVPQLPLVGSQRFPKKGKTQMTNGMLEEHQQLQGFSHGALLFCLGMSIGLISTVLNNKREVDNLSNLLKQTESLVQDLQEELEMKDSLTVKELAVEDCESQDTQNGAFNNGSLRTSSPDVKLNDQLTETNTQKAEEESFSKIEAELEAELERLELSISSHGLDKNMLNLAEDADYVPHAISGELNADIIGQQSGPQPYADRDGSGSSTPRSVHYAVSPRELTLRLHELIQSRLEKRIEELEIALQNSQMKVRYMESQNASYLRELSNRRLSFSSTKGSPIFKEESCAIADQPVVINLSEEALDEYTKSNELDEDDALVLCKDNHRNGISQAEKAKIYQDHDNELNHIVQMKSFNERLMLTSKQEPGHNDKYSSNGFLTDGMDHEEEDDITGYDEMEELLIKHIVEQARKGSPVVFNAQRALSSSPDDDIEEHS